MKVLDLFSGIGGFSLGFERAGMETVAFCEYSESCRRVLKKHWPDVPCYEDVRTLTAEQLRDDGITTDVICGGFPCQDLSIAGIRKGFDGEKSSLYREMLRIISDCRPRYAVFENVANFLIGDRGRWFSEFLNDLARIGYDAEWHCISAAAVGANHKRSRVWVVAYPAGNSIKGSIFEGTSWDILLRSQSRGGAWAPIPGTPWATRQPGFVEVDDGLPGWVGEARQYGNAVVPAIPEIIGRCIMKTEGLL